MSTEIAKTDTPLQLPAVTQDGLNALTEMTKSSKGFLSRVQLYTKGKAINHGLVMPGEYGIAESEDDITRLGKTMDVVPLAWRPKALDISDRDDIKTSYDAKSAEFQRIKDEASTKDSGCMFGPSFLLYERSSGRFLEWFCNNESARNAAGKVSGFLPQTDKPPAAMTVGSRVAEKKSYSWHVPTITECSTPITLPDSETVMREVERFLNPPAAQSETASAEEVAQTNRRAR